jgi:uncharacterized protein
MHGQFSWYDLMTPDSAAAKKFYPSVTDWGTEEWDKADYTMWTAGGVPMGGINPITPEQTAQGIKPHWLAYITVDDVESAANKVRSLGGKVMHTETIPDVGRFAIIQDPQGAMVAIIKSDTPSDGFDGTPTLGRFSWHELMTTDTNRAFDFYRQLFGWEKIEEMDMGPGGKYLEYGKNGKMYGGMFNRRPEHGQMPPNWTYYANVKSVAKSIAAAKRAGGGVVLPPMEVPGGSIVAVLVDDQGAMFAVHEIKAKTAAKPAARSKAKPKKQAASRPKARPKAKAKSKAKAKPKARAKARKSARAKPRPKAKRAAKKKARRR